ncbi:DNA polymerase III subunit delta' [Hydrogenophaga sp.]|uniref:DNA polymerase III subunit delta' n=1 Tax=Hydrogenophaga sp. TaxID=1904254 RepID=UPI001985DC09|nr:DNA polymerase III subunit delta' [Hydrogenophaga sp.]MBD3892547.1 DNA polymerase III subunit delta' [Hydrogenophaga sp.]
MSVSLASPPPLAPWLLPQLASLLTQRGHALLLCGPSGLGQYELALALARAWLCERPSAHGACGVCGSCHAVDVRTHADLCVLLPESLHLKLAWPLEESAQKEIDDKKRQPSKWIRVEAARSVIHFTQFTSARGGTQVVLVYPAERMNPESANTLLKTLEEPLGQVRFVLASEAAHQLLPTIRSRCQSHAMVWPQPEQALNWLQAQSLALGKTAATREQAAVWLQAAGGRPDDALAWARSGLDVPTWTQLPQALARGDWTLLADWPPVRQLVVLQQLCHDLMALAAGGAPRFFLSTALPAPPSWRALAQWSRDLMAAARTVEHPFNAALMQEAWAARARTVWEQPQGPDF